MLLAALGPLLAALGLLLAALGLLLAALGLLLAALGPLSAVLWPLFHPNHQNKYIGKSEKGETTKNEFNNIKQTVEKQTS